MAVIPLTTEMSGKVDMSCSEMAAGSRLRALLKLGGCCQTSRSMHCILAPGKQSLWDYAKNQVSKLNSHRSLLRMLLFVGANDENAQSGHKLPEAARLIPGATLLMFSGLGHFDVLQRLDLLLPHVQAFVDRVEAAA